MRRGGGGSGGTGSGGVGGEWWRRGRGVLAWGLEMVRYAGGRGAGQQGARKKRGRTEEEDGSVRFEDPHVGHTDCVAAACCVVGEFSFRRPIVPAQDASRM